MKNISFIMLISLITLLTACLSGLSSPGDQPVSSDDTPPPPEVPVDGHMEIGQAAMVESVDVMMLESWPLQVNAVIKGNLPDGCTAIHRVESRLENNRFVVTVYTQRDREAFCTEALVPYEENHALNVYGLPAGTYTVDAYGVTAEFTFEHDNSIQNPGGG
jgi:inhibitor of cysteine peptidase